MFKVREQQTAVGAAAALDPQVFDAQAFDELAAEVAPVLGGQQAQGDLLFDPVALAPARLEPAAAGNVAAGGVQLTPDGHPHVAVPFGPVAWRPTQAWWGVIGVLTVPEGSTVTVLHEDPSPDGHRPLYLAPGVWEVVRQRQWHPSVRVVRPGAKGAVSRAAVAGYCERAEKHRRPFLGRIFPGKTPTFRGLPIVDVEVC